MLKIITADFDSMEACENAARQIKRRQPFLKISISSNSFHPYINNLTSYNTPAKNEYNSIYSNFGNGFPHFSPPYTYGFSDISDFADPVYAGEISLVVQSYKKYMDPTDVKNIIIGNGGRNLTVH